MRLLCYLAFVLGVSSTPTAASLSCTLDLGLVVDTSKSIKRTNIRKVATFLDHLVEQFVISAEGTHVSLMTFDKESTLHNRFNESQFYNLPAVKDHISNILDNIKPRKPTRLYRALSLANDEMFDEDSGKRAGVPSAMVLFHDGRSHPKALDAIIHSDALKAKGIRMIVVAIGPDSSKTKYKDVLEAIGGENLFFAADYDVLEDATQAIYDLICPPMPCEESPGMDIAIILDKTKSVGPSDFLLEKGFILQLCDALDIGPDATHVAIILFARQAEVLNTFADSRYHSNQAVHHAIQNITGDLGSRTYIDRALLAASNELFTEEGGDRPDFPNVIILVTDGKTNPQSLPFGGIVDGLTEKGVLIIAIGVGAKSGEFIGQLHEIAGENHTYTTDNFDGISNLFPKILAETCNVDQQDSDDPVVNINGARDPGLYDLLLSEPKRRRFPQLKFPRKKTRYSDNTPGKLYG